MDVGRRINDAARRLVLPAAALVVVVLLLTWGVPWRTPSRSAFAPVRGDTVMIEDFESGNLNAWQDGVDATRHRVATDASGAQSGSHYLDVTYPAGADGGWLTRFFMPGYDSLYVSVWVRFPTTWQGSTKLIAFYGSRTDNQWSAFGQAGKCPTGADFFAAMVVTEQTGPTRFYTYYPAMAREPDGVTCWGRYGDGTESYVAPSTMSLDAWHHLEFWVRLNTPGQANASQTFWLDGVQRGTWSGLSFRSSSILMLNAVQLTFSRGTSGKQGPVAQHLHVDHLVVATARARR
jgi:polysaccharide lyase-like protein